jgi:4-hydroxy-4-methyl-2-oxoglutarate aldolase
MMDQYLEKLKVMETGAITDSLKLLHMNGWMLDMHPVNQTSFICGRAFTVEYKFDPDPDGTTLNYYELLDHIQPGDVIVLAANNCPYALIGENMQHASKKKGAAGIILDGKNRDTLTIKNYDQPVFSKGHEVRFMEKNQKISAFNVPVMCAGTYVCPGDYIIGDADGVIAIPQNKIQAVLYQAERIMAIESHADEAIEQGAPMIEVKRILGEKKKIRV